MQLGIVPGDEVVTVPDKAVTIIERDQGHWRFLVCFRCSGRCVRRATGWITMEVYIPEDASLVSKVAR